VSAYQIDRGLLQRLASQMSRGEVILFTGAGFSLGAQGRNGEPVPTVAQLKEKLWAIAFPGEALDEASSMGDIFEVAVVTARNATQQLFESTLRIDTNTLTEEYAVWFSMPWARIYTLNVDDLDEAVARTYDVPRTLEVISAVAQEPIVSRDSLLSIHLNGVLGDFPNVTFSQRQYGERLAQPDFWYQSLVRDLRSSPVVFVGTTLDEPSLWQHIEMRGRQGAGRELRPGSYLVSPSLPLARRAILKEHFNIDWIPLGAGEFVRDVLGQLGDAQRAGILHFAMRGAVGMEHALLSVAELRNEPSQDLREYLMAREPVWADLGPEGFAVAREFEGRIQDEVDAADARALLITGTGGSGKSTTLMRYALERQAGGADVRWVDLTTEVSIPRLRRAIRESGADVVVIDDADSFGSQTGPLIAELLEDNEGLFVVAGLRASRYEALEIEHHLQHQTFVQLTVPLLEDTDIELLLDSLTRAHRLGVLRGKTRAEQRESFRGAAGRELIVAMIEATTGERFDEKINRECRDLGRETGLIYAVAALATSLRADLSRQEIVLASGDSTNEGLNRLQGLVNQHLLVATRAGRLRIRHRIIAEKALEYFRSQHQLAEPIRGLMFAFAVGIDRTRYPRGREGGLLVRLMNHDWLIRYLRGDRDGIRAAYDAVEDLMAWDYHYWLQRGSFEVEVGDLQLAQNLLEQARSLASDDYKVQTEWAYLTIKRASHHPEALESRDKVEEAFLELEDAVARRGHEDSYPAHVMGSQGLSWVRQAPLTDTEKLGVLARLRSVVESALEDHRTDGSIRQLARDLEQEYLLVGAVRPPENLGR
jgi:hypothetical protein